MQLMFDLLLLLQDVSAGQGRCLGEAQYACDSRATDTSVMLQATVWARSKHKTSLRACGNTLRAA